MITLWLVTLLWAFSFSLIGVYLAGQVDPYLAVFIRMLLASAVLLPFLRIRHLTPRLSLRLAGIGAIQIGLMYLLLYHAFLYLSVPEVLLFTIFTPLYITLLDEKVINRRPIPARWWLAACIAVVGAAIIRYQPVSANFMLGFLLIQGANLSFAIGQVAYKRTQLGSALQQTQVYALFFFGATLVSGMGVLLFTNWELLPATSIQWTVLLWLGLIASGVGYLAWSIASKKVNIGQLASMNNMLIPAGLLVNYLFWAQDVNWTRLLIGGAVILFAVSICSYKIKTQQQRIAQDLD
ncbi:EamA family transporter [Aliidiomarina minuta]|uniref:EamA family transporter n=1 Tax=Aliidiomarina minuta TaxID=880057 RepID=A0A432W5N4_9GAMM|nr:EamA family transporter [Aliidiomarina minuta]RUO25380.1 EamA family transporter [Aliidiomarina minuta]